MKEMNMIGHEIANILAYLILQTTFNTEMKVNHSVNITCQCSQQWSRVTSTTKLIHLNNTLHTSVCFSCCFSITLFLYLPFIFHLHIMLYCTKDLLSCKIHLHLLYKHIHKWLELNLLKHKTRDLKISWNWYVCLEIRKMID